MKKITTLTGLFFILCISSYPQSGKWQWIKTGGDPVNHGSAYMRALCTDTGSNVYIAGEINSSASCVVFDTDTLFREMDGDKSFIVKYDSTGELKWAKKVGTHSQIYVNELDNDDNGYIYLGLYYYDTLQIDGFEFFHPDETNVLIVKLDPTNGQAVWATQFRGSESQFLSGLEVQPNHGIYTAGYFTSDTLFADGFELVKDTICDYGFYVAKLDFDGHVVWAEKSEGLGDQVVQSLCTDKEGNCYIGGYADSLLTFGTDEYMMDYSKDFIAKYDKDGVYKWSNLLTSDQIIDITHLQCDTTCNLYGYGMFRGNSIAIDTFVAYQYGMYYDLFLFKTDSTGKGEWINQIGGYSEDTQYDLFVDPDGTIYISGSSRLDWLYSGSLSFFSCFDSEGTRQYTIHSQFKEFERDPQGNFVTGGDFSSDKYVNDSSYHPMGYRDVFAGRRNAIDSIPEINVTADITPINGIEETDGVLRIIPEGGTPPYYYVYGIYSRPDTVMVSTPGNYSMTIIDQLGFYTNASFYVGFADLEFDMVEDEYQAHILDDYSIEANYHKNIKYYIWNEQDTGRTVSITEFGRQTVRAVFQSGYQAYDTTNVVWSEVSALDPSDNRNKIALYPNPATDLLMIQTNYHQPLHLKIYSITGVLVIETTKREIDVGNLTPGLYNCIITGKGIQEKITFVKK